MDLKRPSYQRTVWWTMQGLMEPFKNIAGCCHFTEAKSREVCTVLLDKGLFLKNRTTLPIKCSVWPSSRLKPIDLDYHSSLSAAQLLRFWFKKLIAHDRRTSSYKVTYFFWQCTHEVPLHLCSIFCSCSLEQRSTVSYCSLSTEHAPTCIP